MPKGLQGFQKGHKINIGRKCWNTGLTKETNKSVKAISEKLKGRPTWNKGKKGFYKHSEETKQKQRESHLGKKYKPMSEQGKKNLNEAHKGYKMPESQKRERSKSQKRIANTKEWKDRLRNSMKGKGNPMWGKRGDKAPAWRGGKSFEPYGIKFNNQLKEQVRKRDNYRCQQCFRHQNELFTKKGKKYKLSVHHMDYNKRNNNSNNLVSLCRNCHAQTNFDRKDWTNYFSKNKPL